MRIDPRNGRRGVARTQTQDLQRNSGIHTGAAPRMAKIMDAVVFRDARLPTQLLEQADRPSQPIVLAQAREDVVVTSQGNQLADHRLGRFGQVDHTRHAGLLGRQEPRAHVKIQVRPLQGAGLAQAGTREGHEHQHVRANDLRAGPGRLHEGRDLRHLQERRAAVLHPRQTHTLGDVAGHDTELDADVEGGLELTDGGADRGGSLAGLLHLEDEAADMGLGDRGDRQVVEFGPEPVRVAAEIGVEALLLASAALDHIVLLVEHPVSQGRDFRYLGVFALRRLQAVALVEHAGSFEGQEAQLTEPDAVGTLVAGIARVQRDTAGGVDDGTHAAVGGAGKLDLMKAESFDALCLFQKPGLGEGNLSRVRILATADRGHRRTDGNRGMPKVDPQAPANRPARSDQIVEIKLGQVLAGNDLGGNVISFRLTVD